MHHVSLVLIQPLALLIYWALGLFLAGMFLFLGAGARRGESVCTYLSVIAVVSAFYFCLILDLLEK